MDGWRIRRDRTKCTDAGCPLPTAQEYFAVLEVAGECVRRDLCATCFHQLEQRQEQTPIFWKCRRRTGAKTGPSLDLAALRILFDRLADVGDDTARGLRYFVSLLLLRKRMLKMVDPMTPEQERADLVVVDPKVEGMEPVALTAPALDAERLENLEAELIATLAEQDDAARDDAARDDADQDDVDGDAASDVAAAR